MPEEIVALSRVLREAREHAGLTQRVAAAAIGVHSVTLSTWESERRPERPSPENIVRVARAYRTTVAALRERASGAGGAPPTAAASTPSAEPVRASTASSADSSAVAVRADDTDAGTGEGATGRVLPRRAYARVFRLLADLADQNELSLAELAGAQRALTDPALLGVFAAMTSSPLSEDDSVAIIDAAAAAVRTFVTGRRRATGPAGESARGAK